MRFELLNKISLKSERTCFNQSFEKKKLISQN